mmetsp:Transcript_130823/g.279875  ORF Transcript_130823/g.279875 Transcript_130823/m.279875 type:complete len:422 (-) Transcript_130823:104-1369(-)
MPSGAVVLAISVLTHVLLLPVVVAVASAGLPDDASDVSPTASPTATAAGGVSGFSLVATESLVESAGLGGSLGLICCLIVLPMTMALVVFSIVDGGWARGELGQDRHSTRAEHLLAQQQRQQHGPPLVARPGSQRHATFACDSATDVDAQRGGAPGSSLSLAAVSRASLASGVAHRGFEAVRGTAEVRAAGPRPGSQLSAAMLSEPPSLRILSSAASVAPPEGPLEESSVSPLITHLLVRNPYGVFVHMAGDLLPHPEQRTIDVVKDDNIILRAHISETICGNACIRVETRAKRMSLAVMDTSGAIFPRGKPPPPPELRQVVLRHAAVAGDGREALGPPCAWITPAGSGTFKVHCADGDLGLTVQTSGNGAFEKHMIDPKGQTMARGVGVGGKPGQTALWVRHGADMAFVACVAIAVQKLS